MKVKKYLKLEKEEDGRGPQKSLCTSSKGTEACQEACFSKLSDDVFRVHNRNKHHPCKIPAEDESPYCLYIVVAMSDNLSDQSAHAKVCSSYHYEQQTEGKGDDPKLLNLYNLVISSTVPVARTF